MKRLSHIIFIAMGVLMALASCNKEKNNWEEYKDWRNANNLFIEEKSVELNEEGTGYAYEKISPNWDKGSVVLMKKLKHGTGNRYPLYTSYVDVIYKGTLYDGTPFDSTYSYTDSITTLKLSATVQGFAMALTNMVEGDSCEVIIPAYAGYGEQDRTNIPPYSALIFGIKLVDIPAYEKPYEKD
jgi:FKBP-type peptidyl-prolyl cis-trans isomerase FklB